MGIEKLMENWESALLSYNTPADFADNTLITVARDNENKKSLPITLYESSGYLRRIELMKKAKEKEGKKTNEKDYCFLCENINQARSIGNNLTLPWKEYKNQVICPNRFPFVRGHFLLINKNHDLPGPKVGNTINPQYLRTIINIAKKYNVTVIRNHKFAGMSIPEHEHCQAIPRLVKTAHNDLVFNGGLLQTKLKSTKYGKDIFSVDSDLDTLALKENLIEKSFLEVLKKFEKNNIIFTFAYDNGFFYLTPHSKRHELIGAGDPNYLKIIQPGENFSYVSHINLLKEHIFPKGIFPWNNYFS
jgi:hypothetical protein